MKLKFPTLLMLIGLAFSACQKEVSYEVDPGNTGSSGNGGSGGGNGGGGSSSGYYIKGKKDGNAFSYTNVPMAMITSISGATMVSLSANASSNGSSLEGIALQINFFNGASLATTTYAENDTSLDHIIAGVYNPNSTTVVYGAGQTAGTVKPLKIVVASKTSSEISGTFEGAFYKTDVVAGTLSTTDYITITEGEFKLPMK